MKSYSVIFVVFSLFFIDNSAIQHEALSMPQKYPVTQEQTEPQEKIMVLSEGRILVLNQNGEILKTIGITDSVQDFVWYKEDTLVYSTLANEKLKISKFCLSNGISKTVVVLSKDDICKVEGCPFRMGDNNYPFGYLRGFDIHQIEKAMKIDNHYLYLQADTREIVVSESSFLSYKIDLDNGTFKMHDEGCTHNLASREETMPPAAPRYYDEKHKKRSEKVLTSINWVKYTGISSKGDVHLSPLGDHIYFFDEIFVAKDIGGLDYPITGLYDAIDHSSGNSSALHDLGENKEKMWDLGSFRISFPSKLIYCCPNGTLYKKKDGLDKFTPVTQKIRISRYELKPGTYFLMKFTPKVSEKANGH